MTAVSSEVEPERVGDQAGEHGDPKAQEGAELPGCGQRARSQQQGHYGQRQPHLFQKDGNEHDRRAVVDEELGWLSHAAKPPSMIRLAPVTRPHCYSCSYS
jgi:hypothetical protein